MRGTNKINYRYRTNNACIILSSNDLKYLTYINSRKVKKKHIYNNAWYVIGLWYHFISKMQVIKYEMYIKYFLNLIKIDFYVIWFNVKQFK